MATEKQIAWAAGIRNRMYADIDRMADQPKKQAMLRDCVLPLIAKMPPEWFIANKDEDITSMAMLKNGEPCLGRVERMHPELIKGLCM